MNDGTAIMRSLLLWGIPFAIVLAALAYETDWGRDIDRDATAPRPAPAAPVTVSLLPEYKIAGGVDARKETVDRVLFNPTRRPAPPAPATAGGTAGSMQKGQYALTGTTMNGNVATAFLREVKGGKSHTVHTGETLNGIVIAEVKPDHVRLKQGNEVEDLLLKIASGPKSTVQVATPPPAVAGQPQPVRQAGAFPGGGSGEPAQSGRAARVAAEAAGNATNPNAAARANGGVSVSEILAERRRAARAAAAAANQSGIQRAQ